jgi:outer membrane beta-barrel protein
VREAVMRIGRYVGAFILLAAVLLAAPPVVAQPRVERVDGGEPWEGDRPAQRKRVQVTSGEPVLLRDGPGGDYAIVATAAPEEKLLIVARLGTWYAVETDPGQTGWVSSSRVKELDPDVHFIVDPRRYRRERSFVFTPVTGLYSAESQSNSAMIGGRMGYYLTDRYEVEAGIGFTRVHRDRDLVEDLFDLLLEEADYQVFQYQANFNVHIVTGRRLSPFVTGGIGTATSNSKTELAWNAGTGMVYYVKPDTGARIEIRNYHFETGNAFTRRTTDNIEATFGISFLF